MVDAELVELCSHCLVGAVMDTESRDGFTLTAIALARDLTHAHAPSVGVELLDAATHAAVARLDASDLDAPGFARALRSLAALRDEIDSRVHSPQPGSRWRPGLAGPERQAR